MHLVTFRKYLEDYFSHISKYRPASLSLVPLSVGVSINGGRAALKPTCYWDAQDFWALVNGKPVVVILNVVTNSNQRKTPAQQAKWDKRVRLDCKKRFGPDVSISIIDININPFYTEDRRLENPSLEERLGSLVYLLDATRHGKLTGGFKMYYSHFTLSGTQSRPPIMDGNTRLVYGDGDIDAIMTGN